MNDLNSNDNCICFVYLFSESSNVGLEFFCESTKEKVNSGEFEVPANKLKVSEWDDELLKYDGSEYLMTRFGYVTHKAYIISLKELYRICHLFDDVDAYENVAIEIDKNEIIDKENVLDKVLAKNQSIKKIKK